MKKAAFLYYDAAVRQMSDGPDADAAPPAQFAIADAVDGLWNDWLGGEMDGEGTADETLPRAASMN